MPAKRTPEARERAARALEYARDKGYGPDTDPARQVVGMRWLRDTGGCSYAAIGDLFGLSGESVRLKLEGKSTRLLTEAEWQLVQAVRAGTLDAAREILAQRETI